MILERRREKRPGAYSTSKFISKCAEYSLLIVLGGLSLFGRQAQNLGKSVRYTGRVTSTPGSENNIHVLYYFRVIVTFGSWFHKDYVGRNFNQRTNDPRDP